MQPPATLIDDLRAAGLPDAAAEAPDLPGAYLLLMELARPAVLSIPRFAGTALPAGWYVYAGSANGPGGLRARVARHLRRHKRIHWHVDHLTAGAAAAALCYPGGDECDLVATLAGEPAFTLPLPGFGSTDSRRCASHLLRRAAAHSAVLRTDSR